jgi:uncharacterized small protein (DUF1192 family)
MTTDTDSRVAEAMRLHKVSTRSHHVWQTLRALGEQDERAQAAVDDHTALMTYLAAEFAKVSSAPVVAVVWQWRQLFEGGRTNEWLNCTREQAEKFGAETDAEARALGVIAITPPQAGKTENEIDRLETEVARLTAELNCTQGAYDTAAVEVERLEAELQEARKIVQALECLFSPYATDSTQRDWMDRAAAMTKEKPNGRPE